MADRIVQDGWVVRVLGAALVPTTDSGLSLVALGRARLSWAAVRSAAVADIGKVKSAVAILFANDAAQQTQLAAALARLDALATRLDTELEGALDRLLNAAPEGRAVLRPAVHGLLGDIVALIDNDPVLATIDGNEVTPNARIAAPMKAALGEIRAALG